MPLNFFFFVTDAAARKFFLKDSPGNPHRRGRLGTVDLLVRICLDQLLLILEIYFFTKHAEKVNRTKPSRSVSVPWIVLDLFADTLLSVTNKAVV
jgi:hypothetical protein